jgi:hypothetical protein
MGTRTGFIYALKGMVEEYKTIAFERELAPFVKAEEAVDLSTYTKRQGTPAFLLLKPV